MRGLIEFQQATSSGGSSAPWWGVVIIAGAFTLAGVMLTVLSTMTIDILRRQHERQQRIRSDGLSACVEFLHQCDRIEAHYGRIMRVEKASEEMWKAITLVELVCSPEIAELAKKVDQSLEIRNDGKEVTPPDKYYALRKDCQDLIRQEYGPS